MNLYLEGKKVTINPSLLEFIGKGCNGKVYKYNGEALKILYNDCCDLDLKTGDYLKDIKTKRILLPKKIYLDEEGSLKAYTTELITKSKTELYNISKDKFIEELYCIEKELNLLSEKYIYVTDWHLSNFIYDGMFRFIDSGTYIIDDLQDIDNIEFQNNVELKNFVFAGIIISKFYNDFNEKFKQLKVLQCEYSLLGCNSTSEFVEATMDRHDTLYQYAKKKIKNR